MSKLNAVGIGFAIVCLASGVGSVYAQKLETSVLYRQNSDNSYIAVIPGYSDPTAPDCAADLGNSDCYNPTHATKIGSTPPVTYNVVGTTLSLLLPDGKVAVVNCLNKYSYKGNYMNRRSCAMPLVEHVEADFNGNSAKLKWPVGADGKKIESETYKVVAMLDKR